MSSDDESLLPVAVEMVDVQAPNFAPPKKRVRFAEQRTRCKRMQIYIGWCMLTCIVFAIVIAMTWQACGAFSDTMAQLDVGNANYTDMVRHFRAIAADVYPTMNRSANPCIDAYEWACGGFLANTELGPGESRITKSFSELEEANLDLLRLVIEDEWPIVTPFFRSCNESYELGNFSSVLWPLYDLINSSNTSRALFVHLALLRSRYGLDTAGFAFHFDPTINIYLPTERLVGLWQGDVTLPSAHYYNPATSPIDLQAYRRYIVALFALSPTPISADDAGQIVAYEAALSDILLSAEAADEPAELFNKIEWSRLHQMVPSAIAAYIDTLDLMTPSQRTFFSLGTATYFIRYQDLLVTTPFAVLKNVALYTLYKQTYPLMASQYSQAARELSSLLNGVKHRNDDRELACLYTVTNDLELLMGHYFVQKAGIDNEYKEHVADLISFHIDAFYARLQSNKWMDATTRIAAEAKLNAMRRQVCFPDDWSDVLEFEQRLLSPLRPDAFFNNSLRLKRINDLQAFAQLGQPVDPNEWEVGDSMLLRNSMLLRSSESPEIVNAFYSPSLNRITIPAGIARPPFLYSYTWRQAPLSAIYGGLGAVIGHEITHGFDNNGAEFGTDGALSNWWTTASEQQFAIATQCVATSRSQLETQVPGLYVNGRRTLGENIADLGGVETALDAMRSKWASLSESERTDYSSALKTAFPDLDETQLFFLFFIQDWCEKATDESVEALVESNPHAPAEARVRGTLADIPRFAMAFQCKSGDPYNPPDRCTVW